MSGQPKPVSVTISEKEYVVACADDERDSLFFAVEFLNQRMKELRDSGKVIGSERIAVMAALNVAHEYLDYKKQNDDFSVSVGSSVRRIQEKIAGALSRKKLEFSDASPLDA